VWGIAGYDPETVTSVDDLLAGHADRLAALVGRRLVRAYGLVLVGERDWCPTLPVVLDLHGDRPAEGGWSGGGGPVDVTNGPADVTGGQVELAASGLDRLHLSWGTIDLGQAPDAEYQDDPEREVEWAILDLPELRPVLGGVVSGVRVLEYELRLDPPAGRPTVDGPPDPDFESVEVWLPGGLELVFDTGRALQVHRHRAELTFGDADPDDGPWRRYDLHGELIPVR
jgi:hypothetical protein